MINVVSYSAEATLLITVHRTDINLELSAIISDLRSALQILQTQVITISRYGNLISNFFLYIV